MTALLRTHWFLCAYVAVIALAWLWPGLGRSGGLLHLELARQWLIAGVFLCAGLALPGARLGAAVGAWRAHLAVQGVSFVIAPPLALGLAWLAVRCGLPEAIGAGIVILGCLPTTIGSCVAITGLAGGNQGIALINSVLGNLLGVIVTPLLVLWLAGRTAGVDLAGVVGQLALVAVLPVALGQLARLALARVLDRHKARIGIASGCLLLAIILSIFSDLAGRGLGAGALGVIAVALALHLALLAAGWGAAALASRASADRSAIAITASHKTAALGIPLIGLIYAGSPDFAMLVLPVALYHAVQQLIGAGMAPWLKRRCATP